jgi:hypothetical protein
MDLGSESKIEDRGSFCHPPPPGSQPRGPTRSKKQQTIAEGAVDHRAARGLPCSVKTTKGANMIGGGSFEDGGQVQEPTLMEEHFYKLLSVAAVGIITLATVLYHWLEEWSWVDSLYFSVVAVTTVGFGDLVPTTDATKLLTVLYILAGIGIITTYLNARLKRRNFRRYEKRHPE